MTLGVTLWYTDEVFYRRRSPLPADLRLVWLDPTEVRVNGLWVGCLASLGRNYGLARFHRYLFRLPGRRRHEARRLRRRRRRLWGSRGLGLSRGHGWRVPWSWVFFYGWSSGVQGRQAEPRLSHYVEWWDVWVLWMVRRCHRPWMAGWRGPRRISRGISRGGVRRYALRVALVRGARVTPPDVRSQLIVAGPRRRLREVGLRGRRRSTVREEREANPQGDRSEGTTGTGETASR